MQNHQYFLDNSCKERVLFWDNIKGVLIVLVVFAHFLYEERANPIIFTLISVIYTFHMPAFVFVSGYFSKSEKSRDKDSLLKLGFAYLFFNGIFIVIFGLKDHNVMAITPYYSYWYLLALLFWRISAKYLAKIKLVVVFLIFSAIIAGLWQDITNVLSLSRIICFASFFMAGYLIKSEWIEKLFLKKSRTTILGGILSFIIAACIYPVFVSISGNNEDSFLMGSYQTVNDLLARGLLMVIAVSAIFVLLAFVLNKNIPMLTQIGKNSLSIFILHRAITLVFSAFIPEMPAILMILSAVIATLVTVMVCGSNIVSGWINAFLEFPLQFLDGSTQVRLGYRVIRMICIALAATILFTPILSNPSFFFAYTQEKNGDITQETSCESQSLDEKYKRLSNLQKTEFDNAFRITFAGDMILLEDQVKNAYNGSDYDFSPMFTYTKDYLSSADLTISVFEGPMAGQAVGYSNGNYDDGKMLYLNFPDVFAQAIKDAGVDLVTTANNHLLDKGLPGALRTLDVMDDIGLAHTGSYRSSKEKESSEVNVIEQNGLRFAILSYTFKSNYYDDRDFINGDYSYLTSILVAPDSEYFDQVKESVANDFDKAKAASPDFIIVLPHMGTQFLDYPDEYQTTWSDYFKSLGADIILGDHTHSVQPVEITKENGKQVFTAYCPGNYANSFRDFNGDASALIEVYIDEDSKSIIGGGIVPMWTQSSIEGNYRPLPVYDILNNATLRSEISTYEMQRVEEIHEHITSIMLGTPLDLQMIQKRYYFTKDGFRREAAGALELTPEMKESSVYALLSASESVCFLGDSVTDGTRNGGYPWYEPLEPMMNGEVNNFSYGGGTVQTLLDHISEIQSVRSDLYVIAIGTNDVRYRDETICAMTSIEYVDRMRKLCEEISSQQEDADFIFIAPWTSMSNDPYCSLSYEEKMSLISEYSQALKAFCVEKGYLFINANTYIDEVMNLYPVSDYLLDHIHPNANAGILLYSSAVLMAETNNR